jgi:hypothetical protein
MALTSLTGHELLIVGFGAAGYCGLCDAQMLNASWVAWFKNEVEFAASKGVGISAYTLMQVSMSNMMHKLVSEAHNGPAFHWHYAVRVSNQASLFSVGLHSTTVGVK